MLVAAAVAAAAPAAASAPPAPPGLAALLTADALGVPPEWTIRDADAATVAAGTDAELADLDPFLGLLDCPAGPLVEQRDGDWLSRRYAAPELPLDNGILSAEITIETESASDAEADAGELAECTTTEQNRLTVESDEIGHVAGEPVEALVLELVAAPSADVPYPAAFNAAIAHVGDYTVTVVLGGIDMGESWQQQANDVAALALDALDGDTFVAPSPAPEPAQPTTP